MSHPLAAAQQLIKSAKSVLFITGAGLSADSGLPTYRGVGGLYEGQRTDEGYAIETALSASMFRRHPEITWKYLWQIGSACYRAKFNQGHAIIADIEKNKPNTWVLTQNIDGFHHQAGSKNLIEIHGRAERLYCLDCDFQSTSKQLLANYQQTISLPPHCPQCGGLIRPDVVLFEEMLPEKALSQLHQLLDTMPFDMVVVVGTSAQFPFHKTYQNLLIVEQIGFVFTSCFNKIAQRGTLGFRYKTPQMRGFTALSQHHTPLGLTFFPQALRLVELTIDIYSINRMNAPLK